MSKAPKIIISRVAIKRKKGRSPRKAFSPIFHFSFLIVDSSIIHHTSSISPQPSDILHLTGRGFFSFYFVVSTFMPNFAECHRTGKECVMCEG